MKKHFDVKEILRRNGINGLNNLNNIQVIGGYYETFVTYKSGSTAKIINADSNTPDSVTIITGSTGTVNVPDSGETYFFISGTTTSTVNGFNIEKTNNKITFSGKTITNGETVDALDDTYYTFLGDGILGMGWRILDLNATGETVITLDSISISGSSSMTTGTTQTLSVTGTYSNSNTTDATDDVIFSSNDETIATVSITGEVSALESGNVTITATYNDPLTSNTLTDTLDIAVS
jgi:hypothetical protein